MSMYRIDITEEAIEDFTKMFNKGVYNEKFQNICIELIRDNLDQKNILEISVLAQDKGTKEANSYKTVINIPVIREKSCSENGEIIENIIELEAKRYADNGYLDEGEQGELGAFYECLGRELRMSEWKRIMKMAKVLLGEEE